MKLNSLLAIAAISLLSSCGQPADDTTPITSDNIRAHMKFLASDLMEGRETGSRGYDIAAQYVATQFELMGLQPAGTDGYMQPVKFMKTTLVEGSSKAGIESAGGYTPLEFGVDFMTRGSYGAPQNGVTAPVVFVGFGISAPSLDHDDYENIDVKGKIVAFLDGAPSRFPTDERAYYSSSRGKVQKALEAGAVGLIGLRTKAGIARNPWDRMMKGVMSPGFSWVDGDGIASTPSAALKGSIAMSKGGGEKLFAHAPQSYENVLEAAEADSLTSFDLNVTVQMEQRSNHGWMESANIAGILEGSDPKLKNEYVIYTAHLDHIGVRPSGSDDTIHNGAYDNAAGTAIVLEMVKAMKKAKPKRSIMFLMVTGEEKGLQGSDYFAHNPTVPKEQIVANINIDMPVLEFQSKDLIAFGGEHTTLIGPITKSAKTVGLTLSPDPWPAMVIFIRSDHFSFVKQGIPAVMLWPGLDAADPNYDGDKSRKGFMSTHYHRPSDDMSLPFDPAAAEQYARVNYLVGLEVANAKERPKWQDNDFFGNLFAN